MRSRRCSIYTTRRFFYLFLGLRFCWLTYCEYFDCNCTLAVSIAQHNIGLMSVRLSVCLSGVRSSSSSSSSVTAATRRLFQSTRSSFVSALRIRADTLIIGTYNVVFFAYSLRCAFTLIERQRPHSTPTSVCPSLCSSVRRVCCCGSGG